METFPAAKKEASGLAFEIENIYASPRAIADLLNRTDGVSDVKVAGGFASANDIRVEFKYQHRDYIVWEPYGDNSRYWIGPKDLEHHASDIVKLENAFKAYRPSLFRALVGDLLTLRFLKRSRPTQQ